MNILRLDRYMKNNKRYRFRLVLPSFSNLSVYSHVAKSTTSLGPLNIATMVNRLDDWDAEVVDENNCRSRFCPRDREGRPDHAKLQEERPADVVGFYGSLSSTVPRIYEIAETYKRFGVRTVAGGKHIENLPEESLANNIDVVVIGEGEITIQELLLAWQSEKPLDDVKGVSFLRNGETVTTAGRPLITDLDSLPDPDFGLLRYARMKFYPVARIRGCNMNCEFCAVKDKTRFFSSQKAVDQIIHLVETRKAVKFFEVSDHFAADREAALEFCRLLEEYRKKTGAYIEVTVQIRLNDAKDRELLEAMKRAGVYQLAIGFESPIDEDLITMRKGYLSRDMLAWTNIYHSYGFFIHGMFI